MNEMTCRRSPISLKTGHVKHSALALTSALYSLLPAHRAVQQKEEELDRRAGELLPVSPLLSG